MELVMTTTAGECGPAALPAGCGAVAPAAGFGEFLSAALHGHSEAGAIVRETLLAGAGSTAEHGVRDSGRADRNPVSGGDGRIAPAGAEVDSTFSPDAGGAVSPSPVPALPAAGHNRSADASAPVSGERLLPGNAAAPGQTAAAGKAAPVPDGAVPAGASGMRLLPGAPDEGVRSRPAVVGSEMASIPADADAGPGGLRFAVSAPAAPEPHGFPGRVPEGIGFSGVNPTPERHGIEPAVRGVQPPRLDAPPGGTGEAPAAGKDRSVPGAAGPNERESQSSVQSNGARAETVPNSAAPVRIMPGAADDGLRLPPAALRAEAVPDRSGPEAAHSQPQPQWPAAGPLAPASRAPAPTTIVPEPAGAPAGADRQTPVPNAGQSTAEFFPPGIRPPAAADPSPVTRQLAEAVVHHVRQIQVKAGEAVRVSIALDPPELGRVTLKLTFGRLGLEAVFYTPDRSVKAVIEQALPQLREALARQEINLNHTGVFLGEEKAQERPRFFRGSEPGPGVPGEPDIEPPESGRPAAPGAGGLDYLV